ncbi:MAG: hypothetical protein ACTHKF_11130 [Candidatus Nitrosocosmicus sp.]
MSTTTTSVLGINPPEFPPHHIEIKDIVVPDEVERANYAGPFFGINLPYGVESTAFIQNVTQLAKMGFDSPQNAKLFIQLDSIALNSSSHPGNRTLTAPAIKQITSVYNQMKSNNSTGGFTQIATIAMQALDNKRSFFDGAGRNITVVPNSLDFSDILKFGTLGAEFVCGGTGQNSGGYLVGTLKSGPACVAGDLGAAAVKLTTLS